MVGSLPHSLWIHLFVLTGTVGARSCLSRVHCLTLRPSKQRRWASPLPCVLSAAQTAATQSFWRALVVHLPLASCAHSALLHRLSPATESSAPMVLSQVRNRPPAQQHPLEPHGSSRIYGLANDVQCPWFHLRHRREALAARIRTHGPSWRRWSGCIDQRRNCGLCRDHRCCAVKRLHPAHRQCLITAELPIYLHGVAPK